MRVKKNRALPHKAVLTDSDGYQLTDYDITSPPVIQVEYQSNSEEAAADVTSDALSPGNASIGNQFVINQQGEWQFNLVTKNYTSPGLYKVSMVSGDSSEYSIVPTCTSTFSID